MDIQSVLFSSTGNTEIEVKHLDNVFDYKDKVITIKINAESHECQVIEGADRLLASNRCRVHIESTPDKPDLLKHKLTGPGYRHIGTVGDHYFTNLDSCI